MEDSQQTTVLFADVSGSTKLYETAGDAVALTAIGRCIERMRKAAESTGGRVVKTIGDEIMALFPSPDAAAGAASEMHATIEQLPEVGGAKLGVRVGFHSGPVIQREDDVFGDTVNMAARLVEQAGKGQIIISHETAGVFSPAVRKFTRPPYPIQGEGQAGEGLLFGGMWRPVEDRTTLAGYPPQARPPPP